MKYQNGATLIIILIILVIITIIGTFAVRSSVLGLRIATNSQVQTLLMENTNAALFNIENPDNVARNLAQDGMFSYFNSSANADDELVFCYQGKATTFFSMTKASAISNGSTTKIGTSGFCKATYFASARSAVLSQVYIKKNKAVGQTPLSHLIQGTSVGQTPLPVVSNSISVTAISVLPTFSSATNTQIETCFKKPSREVTACFAEENIPYNTQHADYIVGGQPKLES
jgi:Tfp pilus assembly protein PilX